MNYSTGVAQGRSETLNIKTGRWEPTRFQPSVDNTQEPAIFSPKSASCEMVFHMYYPPRNATIANDCDLVLQLVCYLHRSANFVEWPYLSTCTKANARSHDTLSTCSSFGGLPDTLFECTEWSSNTSRAWRRIVRR